MRPGYCPNVVSLLPGGRDRRMGLRVNRSASKRLREGSSEGLCDIDMCAPCEER